jgi:hypothetical protein
MYVVLVSQARKVVESQIGKLSPTAAPLLLLLKTRPVTDLTPPPAA